MKVKEQFRRRKLKHTHLSYLQHYCARVVCVRKGARAPFPPQAITLEEVATAVYVLARAYLNKEAKGEIPEAPDEPYGQTEHNED